MYKHRIVILITTPVSLCSQKNKNNNFSQSIVETGMMIAMGSKVCINTSVYLVLASLAIVAYSYNLLNGSCISNTITFTVYYI